MSLEIAGYYVYFVGEMETLRALNIDVGERRCLQIVKYINIYCTDEEDAKQLSSKIEGSTYGEYYKFSYDKNSNMY